MTRRFYLALSRFLPVVLSLITFKGYAQMQSPAINHVAVYVFDLSKSTAFYKDIIGLTLIAEPFKDGKHAWFTIGEHCQLHIIQGAETITTHEKNSHTCFSVASMEGFIASINKNKIPFENATGIANAITTRPDGIQQIYIKDPDGYWIEINNDRY